MYFVQGNFVFVTLIIYFLSRTKIRYLRILFLGGIYEAGRFKGKQTRGVRG